MKPYLLPALCLLVLCACGAHRGDDLAWWPADGPQLPLYAGREGALRTILVYTNPQCPPCRRSWPLVRALAAGIDRENTRLLILGRGFTAEGTRLMFLASLLAEQQPDLGLEFLTDVMEQPEALASPGWASSWVAGHGRVDARLLDSRAASPQAAEAYLRGVSLVRDHYDLTHTPTLVVNGRVYDGPFQADSVLEALDKR